MSSTSNVQNVLANVVRPVYTYDPATSNYVAKVIISNVDTFSVRTIEVENLEFGDANRNLYLGVDAGSTNSNSASNVAIGFGAAENNINTRNSVFVGYTAGGADITDASASVVLGANTRSGGSSNVYVGYGTGLDSNTASGNVFVGPAIVPATSVSNEVRIGKGGTIPFYANMNNGYTGINTIAPNYELDVSASTTNLRGTLRVVGHAGATLESAQPSAVELGDGDDATGSTGKSTMSLQWNGGGFRHMVRTRHTNATNSVGNAIDLFVNNSGTAGGSSAPGVGNVLALSATAAGVGIGRQDPSYALDVSGTIRAAGILTTGGSSTFGDVILGNGTVSVLDGSAAVPSYTFQNDPSLGLFRTSTSGVGVTTAGLERMRVDSNGRIGIGLTNPSFTVDVSGTVRAVSFIGTSGSGSSGGVSFNSGAVAVADGTVSVPTYTFQNDLSLGLYRQGANTLGFASAGSNRRTLSNGNLGIGTTTPAYSLDVAGTTQTSNAIVSGYLRNALTPSQFDISGGNISNSGTTTSSNFIGTASASNSIGGITLSNSNVTATNAIVSGYLRNALAPTQFDISGGTLFLSNRILTGAGTVSAPSHTFANDVSMGLYDPATNVLGIVTAGVERMRITSNGNVGIATTTPQYFLDVSAGGSAARIYGGSLLVTSNNSLTAPPGMRFTVDNSDSYIQWGSNTTASGFGTTNLRFTDINGGTERMRITSNGNVGIGITAPAYILDISTATSSQGIRVTAPNAQLNLQSPANAHALQMYSDSNGQGLFTTGTRIQVSTNGVVGTNGLFVSGNQVGVGTAAPTNALDVSASGTVTAQFRNTSAQAGVRVTGGGFTDGSGLLLYHSNTAQGLFASNLVPLQFSTNGTTRVTIDSSGAMGIGLTNPSTALNTAGLCVAGNIRMGTTTTDYRQFVLSGGNSLGYLYGAFAKYGDGIHIGYNFHNNNTSNVIPTSAGATSRQSFGYGTIAMYTGAANTEPTRLGYYQNSNGNVGIGTSTPTALLDVSGASTGSSLRLANPSIAMSWRGVSQTSLTADINGGIRILQDASLSSTYRDPRNATDTLTLQSTLGQGSNGTASIVFRSATDNNFYSRIYAVDTGSVSFLGDLVFQTANGVDLVERTRITSAGRMGIGTPSPSDTLDVSGTLRVTPNATALFDVTSGPAGYATVSTNGYFAIYAPGTSNKTASNTIVSLAADPGGSHVFLRSTKIGIGTAAPAYALDVSVAPNAAAVNMTTWPRMQVSNVLIARGIAGIVGNTINWSNTPQQAIDSNLMTVVLSNATNGCSFKVLKSGLWTFSWTMSSGTAGNYTWMDVSTNDNSNVSFAATGSPYIAFAQASANYLDVHWTGYLPSNANYFYKIRESATPSTGNPFYLQIIFHHEMPASAATFPF